MKKWLSTTFLISLLWSTQGVAEVIYMRVSAGTGFFVNKNGHLVTNAHVVQNCQSINILTPVGERPAELVAVDRQHDLALLRVADMGGAANAPLRWNISDVHVGDVVNLIGFPGQAGANGRYTARKTSVVSLEGPASEPLWIQLASVAQKGNSGGPVLDNSGNVIAVVSGIAQTYRVARTGTIDGPPIGQSDIAITLATLRDFLNQNGVSYYESNSGLVAYSDSTLERNALSFIAPVRCIQGRVNPPTDLPVSN